MTMQGVYRLVGFALLALAVFVVRGALQLRYYTTLGPGPGFFSFWLGLVLGLLALIMIVQTFWTPPERVPADFVPDHAGALRVGAVALSLLAAALLMERIGFCLTMLAVFVFLLRSLGGQGVVTTLAAALIGSFGVDYVFVHWLGVPLPAGILGFG
jgi:putative tricarboxylic transport membrane protein